MFHWEWHKIELDIGKLIIADFGAGAVLITFGALLGKLNTFQLLAVACFEIFFYGLNEELGVQIFGGSDMGGSMYVHTFGAIFGVACAWIYRPKTNKVDDPKDSTLCGGNYYSNLIAFIGTIFLWMYWPSFNGALATNNA